MAEQHLADRAKMPQAHNPVLERRTVENANRNLLKYLRPGLSVLDVGCGSGAITRSIAEKTGANGSVLGIDPNPNLIALAKQQAGDTPPLTSSRPMRTRLTPRSGSIWLPAPEPSNGSLSLSWHFAT